MISNLNSSTMLLTKRELEILKYIAQGASSQQIADTLFISRDTVKNHRKNMLRKTKAKNCTNLVRMFLQKMFEEKNDPKGL